MGIEANTSPLEERALHNMSLDGTLAGLMSRIASLVGDERLALALRAEGRKTADSDWELFVAHPTFEAAFEALRRAAASAGWGTWQLVSRDDATKECVFRAQDHWEGLYQRGLNVAWGSGMLAGRLAGICSKYYSTNCWATQTKFLGRGDPFDEFIVTPSDRNVDEELAELLAIDGATPADLVLTVELARRRTEATEARSALDRYRLIYEQIPAMCFTVDPSGVMRSVNEFGANLLGYAVDELVDRAFEDTVVAEDRVRARYLLETCFSNFGTVLQWDVRKHKKDGSVIWVREVARAVHGVPATDAADPPPVLLVVSEDITQRQAAKSAERRLEGELRKAHRLDAISTLIDGFAHDFNNMLAAIVGNAGLAQRRLDRSHRAYPCVEDILRASQNARDLTERMQTFTRPGNHLAQRTTSLVDVVVESIRLLRVIAPPDVTFELHATDQARQLGYVVADPTQIHQIMVDLGTNAWQAMSNRGTVTIELDVCDVDPEVTRHAPDLTDGRCARLAVRDRGVGMDRATLLQIFEPFFTTKKTEGRSGLGLAAVHGIMKAHRGGVVATSELGKGATFVLYFPVVDEHPVATAAAPEAPPLTKTQEPLRILYIDDDATLVSFLERLLPELGHQITATTSPERGLEIFRASPNRFDLVVTDYSMPSMRGIDVARELSRARPGVPIAITSGYMTTQWREEAREVGIMHFIQKPGVVEGLDSAIQAVQASRTRTGAAIDRLH